jgi:hypothetical protein
MQTETLQLRRMAFVEELPLNKGYWKTAVHRERNTPAWYHSPEDEERGIYHLVAGLEDCTCEVRCPYYTKYVGTGASA